MKPYYLFILVFLLTHVVSHGQEPPPKPISVTAVIGQGIQFGAIIQGFAGGTVSVDENGTRMVTGDIFPGSFGYTYNPAYFEIEANPGTLINIINGPDVTLTGSNGGTMTMHIGNASTGSPFIITTTPPLRTQVRIGGTLTVGSPLSNPSGDYSGTFSVIFTQE